MTDATNPSAKTGEPVAWLSTDEFGDQSTTPNMDTMLDWRRYGRAITPLYTHPQPSLSVGPDREAVRAFVKRVMVWRPSDYDKTTIKGAMAITCHQVDVFEQELRSLLALAAPAEGWQPIEQYKGCGPVLVSTAPESPKYLFSHPVSAFRDVTGVWRCLGSIGGGAELACQPTHFRALPAAPTGETGA